MPKAADKDASSCYEKAHAAQERAPKALNTEVRKFYLETEARWLRIAASYENAEHPAAFVARLSALSHLGRGQMKDPNTQSMRAVFVALALVIMVFFVAYNLHPL